MCNWGNDVEIYVIRRNNDYTPDGWHSMMVDKCISNYVQEMNVRGIITTGCCCGHGKGIGSITVDVESIPLLNKYGYNFNRFDDRIDDVIHFLSTFEDWG